MLREGKLVEMTSGVHDLRLFRDGQLVGYLAGLLPLGTDGTATRTFTVRLPHRAEMKSVAFSAYAFNDDQVKSSTAHLSYTLPAALPARKGRAYLITVGINRYETRQWDLRFAANDARRMGAALQARLAHTGAYDQVIWVPLLADGDDLAATKAAIRAIIDRLAGRQADMTALPPEAAKLRPATPDDLLILTWSGHGYTSADGQFYLIPYDIGPAITRITPEVLQRAISSEELSSWLRDVDAGNLAFIIDACHSAASVEGGGFKPGPMGARGLGQLAYDKGMAVLAATQADNVAMEDDRLQQGLLRLRAGARRPRRQTRRPGRGHHAHPLASIRRRARARPLPGDAQRPAAPRRPRVHRHRQLPPGARRLAANPRSLQFSPGRATGGAGKIAVRHATSRTLTPDPSPRGEGSGWGPAISGR